MPRKSYVIHAPAPLGDLTVRDVYAYHDEPVLYRATTERINGRDLLGMFAIDTDAEQVWYYALMTPAQLHRLCAGETDLHDAFIESDGGFVFAWHRPRHTGDGHVEQIPVSDLRPEQLPTPGAMLCEPLTGDSLLDALSEVPGDPAEPVRMTPELVEQMLAPYRKAVDAAGGTLTVRYREPATVPDPGRALDDAARRSVGDRKGESLLPPTPRVITWEPVPLAITDWRVFIDPIEEGDSE